MYFRVSHASAHARDHPHHVSAHEKGPHVNDHRLHENARRDCATPHCDISVHTNVAENKINTYTVVMPAHRKHSKQIDPEPKTTDQQ